MNRNIKVKKIQPWLKGRTIFISDIHGNLDLYIDLLNTIHYSPNIDRLILVGDFIEKGPKNLDTLRYIMYQSENEEVHCIMGNCDFTLKNAFLSYRLDFLKHILNLRKHSCLHEMANQIQLDINVVDMETYCQTLRKNYLKELSFISDLPHVIECDTYIAVHAGLHAEQDFGNDFRIPLTSTFFMEKAPSFKKRVVVGHMPVTEYQRYIASFDPIYSAKKNLYSIDGGNVVKKAGQLNALIFEGNKTHIKRMDHLRSATVIQEVPYQNQIPFFVTWNRGNVKVLKSQNNQYYVYNPYLNRSFWIDSSFLSYRDNTIYATDYTNYQIPLHTGDKVKIVRTYQDKVQIKKDGILGWTFQKNIKEED